MVDIGHRPGRRSLGPRAASGDFLPYFVHFSGRRFGGKNPPAILSEYLHVAFGGTSWTSLAEHIGGARMEERLHVTLHAGWNQCSGCEIKIEKMRAPW